MRTLLLLGVVLFELTGTSAARDAVRLDVLVQPATIAGNRLESAVLQLKEKYQDALQVRWFYAVQKTGNGQYASTAGPADYQEAWVRAVIRGDFPKKLVAYIRARNTDGYHPIWEHAAKWAGLDPGEIKRHMESTDADELWKPEQEFLRQAGSLEAPAVVLNGGKTIRGDIGLAELDYLLQEQWGQDQPVGTMTVVYDPAAPQSVLEEYVWHLHRHLPDIRIQLQKTSSELERRLAQIGILTLPQVLADQGVLDTYYANYVAKEKLRQFGDQQWVFPLLNRADTMLRKEAPRKTVTVFMQSHCPFARRFMQGLLEAKEKGKTHWAINPIVFIIQAENIQQLRQTDQAVLVDAGKLVFSSLHGEKELEEDLRQLAIRKHYPEHYWPYLKAFYAGKPDGYLECLKQAGLDAKKLQEIMSREREALLLENETRLQGVSVTQSPTVLVNDRYLVTDINTLFKKEGIKIEGSCGGTPKKK